MKTEICGICKLGINPEKEFAEFTHYINHKKILSKVFYHIECFRERLQGSKEMQQLKEKCGLLLNKANQCIGATE